MGSLPTGEAPVNEHSADSSQPRFTRRSAISAALAAAGGAAAVGEPLAAADPAAKSSARRRHDMKKSINLWAFPYPEKMSLEACLRLAKDAGFDGIELNYDLDNDLSPKSGTAQFTAIRRA